MKEKIYFRKVLDAILSDFNIAARLPDWSEGKLIIGRLEEPTHDRPSIFISYPDKIPVLWIDSSKEYLRDDWELVTLLQSPLENSVKDIKECQNQVKKSAEESPDVKAGKCTIEDELQEPAYMLYNQIAENSINILQLPAVVDIFAKLAQEFGEDISKRVVELFALTMTQSAHQAVLFYDDLLKQELTKQFDHIIERVNATRADYEGVSGAVSVIRKQLNDIQNQMKIDGFSKDAGVIPSTDK